MGSIQDLLTELPLSAVMKQRVALAEEKFDQAVAEAEELRQRVADLEKEVAELRAQLPSKPAGDLIEATSQALVYLFRCERDDSHVEGLAQHLQVERGIAEYHLEQLETRGLASCMGTDLLEDYVYWGLTPEGRQYVVENDLISK